MNKSKNNKYKILIIVVLLIVLVALSILWVHSGENINIGDLWVNLLANDIFLIFTIVIIDYFNRKAKEKEVEARNVVMYREIQLWRDMYVSAANDKNHITKEDLFSEKTIGVINDNLNLLETTNTINN